MPGIACAGHWVLDRVKFIDQWPKPAEICNILYRHISNGGGPFNILVDLANLQVDLPLCGMGCIGDDDTGQEILKICHDRHINIEFLNIIPKTETSYTDVMTVNDTGVRTMFHFRGANKHFSYEHIPFDLLKARKTKLFYLGHLLLMDALEKEDKEFKIVAGRILHDAQKAGMQTVLDIATESANRYNEIVLPVLPYVDHFVINELEAQKTANILIRQEDTSISQANLRKAAHFLLDHGVQQTVVIHMPEGAYWLSKEKKGIWYPSFRVPCNDFKATCGAGDAFCAGFLYGQHEEWTPEEILHLAVATSALSTTSPHNSDGIKPLKATLKTADKYVPLSEIHHD